jgi:hypothetical protein
MYENYVYLAVEYINKKRADRHSDWSIRSKVSFDTEDNICFCKKLHIVARLCVLNLFLFNDSHNGFHTVNRGICVLCRIS